MPQAIATLQETVDRLEAKLNSNSSPTPPTLAKEWMDIEELRDFLPGHPAKATIYGWTSKKTIPFYKKDKTIYFNRTEIEAWLRDEPVRCDAELEAEALAYVERKKQERRKSA